jgi:hypothetical protein
MVIQSLPDVAKIIGVYWLALIVFVGVIGLVGYAGEMLFSLLPARAKQILSDVGYYLMPACYSGSSSAR